MLDISALKIEGVTQGCITDKRPNISFSLVSDQPGESLECAVITSGRWTVQTTDQLNNLYGGEMEPYTEYSVRVSVKGTSGETAEAETVFQTGRLDRPWTGKWITDAAYDFPDKKSPVPMTFRTRFDVTKPVRRGWINATALGIYELQLNNEKVGTDYFAPGLTSYAHQIQYQTYDVKSRLQRQNTIIAVVGGGWAAGSFNYSRVSKISAERQAFLCELHIEYEDGTAEVIGSDEKWEVSEEGNYREAEWYDGEVYDANVDLNDISWEPANVTSPRGNPRLLAQYGEPVRAQERMKPVSCTRSPGGELIYDFGQNFAGVIQAEIEGSQGQEIIFQHAEVLVEGELFTKSLRTARARAVYICRNGTQTYSPRLTYMGFRYVGVCGVSEDKIQLSAVVLHSDIEEVGTFFCSNDLINRLESNIRWGGKSNFMDIPTDCPQRDERQGWTGDIAVFARTACYHFDMGRFFDKWLCDMRAEQGKGGGIPMVVPRAGDKWPIFASSCWGDSCILVPWAEYLARGNKQMLREQYPTIKKFLKASKWWASFLSVTPNGRHIWKWPFQYGDWCAPDETVQQWIGKGKWVGTAYFANSCSIAANIAELLGEAEDANEYLQLRERIVKSYRKVFTDGKGKLKKEFQTAYVLPLHFEMTEGVETKQMAANLARLVKEADYHLATGFTGTPYLLFALSDFGYVDLAYKVLLQESCPSWLYEVKSGGTTIWERWDALRPDGTVNIGDLTNAKKKEDKSGGMVSFNHYANGAVGDWLYRRVAGIEPIEGGYRSFWIKPLIGGGITSARGEIMTPFGKVVSDWDIRHGEFRIRVEVPVSTKCRLILPNGSEHELESGKYEFKERL